MPISVDPKLCPHDHVCPLIEVCPVGAITQGTNGYPIIDQDLCIVCEQCVMHCPMKAMQNK